MLQLKNYLQKEENQAEFFQFRILTPKDAEKIITLYQSYNGETEFLLRPTKREIQETLVSSESCYVGFQTPQGDLVSVVKLKKIKIINPFFIAPKYDRKKGDFIGISGLLVDQKYRNRALATQMIEKSLDALKDTGIAGCYADCDFRNVMSFNVLSAHFDFLGYTDGRNGAEGEKTLYTTFYKSFGIETGKEYNELALVFPNRNIAQADEVLQMFMNPLGQIEKNHVRYGSGYNVIYLFKNKIKTGRIKLSCASQKCAEQTSYPSEGARQQRIFA